MIASLYQVLFKLTMPTMAESVMGGSEVEAQKTKHLLLPLFLLMKEGYPIRMNFTVVKGFRLSEISHWSKKHLSSGSIVVSDGLACFKAVKDADCQHFSIVTGGGPESVKKEQFIWVNTMIGNVKNSILGTYHAIKHKHLPRYLAEFSYRFNRRFTLEDMLPRFAFIALRTPPMPNKYLRMAELYG